MELEKLAALLAEHLDVDASLIQAETSFDSLGVDSLDTVEMIMELEEHLGVELELDEKVTTVGELLAFIDKKMS